jgi:hypothetical protein
MERKGEEAAGAAAAAEDGAPNAGFDWSVTTPLVTPPAALKAPGAPKDMEEEPPNVIGGRLSGAAVCALGTSNAVGGRTLFAAGSAGTSAFAADSTGPPNKIGGLSACALAPGAAEASADALSLLLLLLLFGGAASVAVPLLMGSAGVDEGVAEPPNVIRPANAGTFAAAFDGSDCSG